MLIKKSELLENHHILIEEEYPVDRSIFNSADNFIDMKESHVEIKCDYISDLVLVNIRVFGVMILASSRTLNPVEFSYDDNEDFTFSYYTPEDDVKDEIIVLDGEDIELKEYIDDLIRLNVPLKVVGKGEKDYASGENWEMISEDEYNRRKNENTNSPFADLKDLLDD